MASSNEEIKANVLKLQNANATPIDIENYVKTATQEMGQSPDTTQPKPIIDQVLDSPLSKGIQSVFPGNKVGDAIGTLTGYGYQKAKDLVTGSNNSENYDLSAASPLSTVGDVAMGALSLTGIGGKFTGTGGKALATALEAKGVSPAISGFAGKTLQSAIQGAYFGAAQGAKDDKTLGDIAKNAGGSAVVSALFPMADVATTKLVGGLVDALPRSMTRSLLGQTKKALEKGKDVSDHFLEEGRIGSYRSLLQNSEKNISQMNSEVGKSLTSPGFVDKVISRNSWLDSMVNSINSKGGAITRKDLLAMITSDVQGGAGLLKKPSLTLPDLDRLRVRIGESINDAAWLANKSTFSKQTLKDVYSTVSESVKKNAPENVRGLFDDLTKEHLIFDALNGQLATKSKSSTVSLKEAVGALGIGGFLSGGTGFGATTAGAAGLGAIKLAESAPVRTLTAQGLYKTGKVLKDAAPAVRNIGGTVARTLNSQ